MGTAFYFNDDYPGFGSTPFNPPLAKTGMVEITSASGHEFEVKFGVPLKDPVFYLGSLGSTVTFPQGTQVTRVSGDTEFKVVDGNKVRGKPFQPPPGTTALTDSNGIVSLKGNFTSVKFTLTPNPDSTISREGVFLQIGGMVGQQLEFVHWRSADLNGATGGLGSVRLTGPMGTAFYFNDEYPGFGSTPFNPPLAKTGMVEITSASGHEFEVKFGVPLKDPVFYLGSLGSTVTFPQGTQVTRVSGDTEFKVVDGNKVRGKPFQPPPGTTALTDSNGIVSLKGNFTSVKFTLTPNPDSTISREGVFLQIGGTPQSLATSVPATEMATA
ncbi:hypothetical protein [Streptomyces sp. NPDC016172]|uniref:hypothetical protein n=1 Tax=Streptomyces sp. NPDC016172 TaxID=3364964 RepID=UPI0036FC1824